MAKTKKIFNVFFREKPALMLINLYNSNTEVYASNLAKHVDCTYSHVVKILQEMSKAGLVTFQKEGRLKILKLTEKGKKIAGMMNDIKTSL